MVQNTLAKKEETFSSYLTSDAVKIKINEMIGGKDGQRFITSIISAVTTNPDLAKCDKVTILSAAMVGEALKLSPSPQLGQFYMMPFKDNKNNRTVATPVIGYKGYIQLAIRSGQYKKINVFAVKEGELIKWDPMNEDIEVSLLEDKREEAETIGYYAMFEYLNGFRKAMYWGRSQMQAHAKKYSNAYSLDLRKGYNYSFWSKDFDSMSLKTMIRQIISKWGIMSVEIQQAFEKDDFSIEKNISSFTDNKAPIKSEDPFGDPKTVEVKPEAEEVKPTSKPIAKKEPELIENDQGQLIDTATGEPI